MTIIRESLRRRLPERLVSLPLAGPAVRQVQIERAIEAYQAVERGDRAEFVFSMPALIRRQIDQEGERR